MPNDPAKTQNLRSPFIRRTLLFMLRFAWREKPGLYGAYLLQFLSDLILRARGVLLPKFLLDELMAVLGGEAAGSHLSRIAWYAGITVGAEFVGSALGHIANRNKTIYREYFNERFEQDLSMHAMTMDFEHTEDPDALDQMSKAQDGISWYSGGVVGILDAFYAMILNAVILCGVAAIIAAYSPLLIPVQAAVLLIAAYLNSRNQKIEVEQFLKLSKVNRLWGYFFWELSDFRYGKDLRLYGASEMLLRKADGFGQESVRLWSEAARQRRKNDLGMEAANSVRDAVSYLYLGILAISSRITVGEFSMCCSAASELYWSVFHLVVQSQEITKKCNYAYQYLRFLEYPSTLSKGTKIPKRGTDAADGGAQRDPGNGGAVTESPASRGAEQHEIEFCDVSFRYPRTEENVLEHINLKIAPGEHLSVVGLNGAGKTTLVKLLCRLYDVTGGAILLDGIDIREYDETEYRRLFSVVFQDFQLFAFSLKENIAFGEDDPARVRETLELSGLAEDAEGLERGMDTMIFKSYDEHGTELSGGQKQKAAISRALYRNAPIVILDEPTAALDPIAEYEIYRKFDTLVGGKSAIYISHRLSSCQFCDRIAVFAGKTLCEYGTHEELVAREGGIYAEMFQAQARYYRTKGQVL